MINVLVVEDSPTIRELLVNLLEQDPEIRVVGQAENGGKAVELAARLHPDLITMDIVMPDMNGLEATRMIMKTNPTAILIVTAHADSPELNVAFEALRAGALDIISKPIAFQRKNGVWEKDLAAKVKSLAKRRPSAVDENNE